MDKQYFKYRKWKNSQKSEQHSSDPNQKPSHKHNKNKSNNSVSNNYKPKYQKPIPKPNNKVVNASAQNDGDYKLFVSLTKGQGWVYTGILKKKRTYNAFIKIETRGELASLVAEVRKGNSLTKISKINVNSKRCYFDVPSEKINGNVLTVTVTAKYKLGLFRRKVNRQSVSLNV